MNLGTKAQSLGIEYSFRNPCEKCFQRNFDFFLNSHPLKCKMLEQKSFQSTSHVPRTTIEIFGANIFRIDDMVDGNCPMQVFRRTLYYLESLSHTTKTKTDSHLPDRCLFRQRDLEDGKREGHGLGAGVYPQKHVGTTTAWKRCVLVSDPDAQSIRVVGGERRASEGGYDALRKR